MVPYKRIVKMRHITRICNNYGGLLMYSGYKVSDYYSDSEVTGGFDSHQDRSRVILEQVIYTRGAQANSAFQPSGVGK